MAKILILSTKSGDKINKFADLVRKNFKNSSTQLVLNTLKDVYVELSPNSIGVKIDGVDVKSYDVVFFRGISGGGIFIATLVAICLEKLGVKYFDRIYSEAGPHRTKLGSLALLAGGNLPIPKTAYFADENYPGHFQELSNSLNLPFVAKEMSLQKGKGVHLINSISDIENLPKVSAGGSKNQYFFQEFINKDHEYRILTLKDKVGVWEEKVKANDSEFRNNVALGATEIFMNAEETPKDLAEVSIKASRTLKLEVAGVDVMTEKETGKVYILEVNRGPGLTYDESVSPEFKALAAFLEDESK